VDDSRLLERVRRGDENAFAELFARHRAAVFRYAAHMGGAGSADDIVQEVFLALLRQPSHYDASRAPLGAYLLGIARRQVFKRIAVPPPAPLDDASEATAGLESPDGNPFDDVSRAETVERVRAAIATLPAVYREAGGVVRAERARLRDGGSGHGVSGRHRPFALASRAGAARRQARRDAIRSGARS
jgi:RNA polymerase sigma-70 factor (ECF subfamily)